MRPTAWLALSLVAILAVAPLALPAVLPAAADRDRDRRPVRHRLQPADGLRRDGVVRPRRLLRAGRVHRRLAGQARGPAACCWPCRRPRWWPPAGALLFGFFIVRLSQTYFAMLSLAFAQIVFTGDLQVEGAYRRRRRPARRLAAQPAQVARGATTTSRWPSWACASGALARHRGLALRLRARGRAREPAPGPLHRHRRPPPPARPPSSSRAPSRGVAGGLFAFYNGSVFPDFAYFTKSFEPLVVALLGGVQSFFGPAGRRLRLQDPRVASEPPVAGVLAALPRLHRRGGDRCPAVGLRGPRRETVVAEPNHHRVAEGRPGSAGAPRTLRGSGGHSGAPSLRTQGLRKHFGGVQAVNGVDLSVPPGDLRAIIGPNGAGKTTLFNLISGDLALDTGQIYFAGEEVSGLPPPPPLPARDGPHLPDHEHLPPPHRAGERADGLPQPPSPPLQPARAGAAPLSRRGAGPAGARRPPRAGGQAQRHPRPRRSAPARAGHRAGQRAEAAAARRADGRDGPARAPRDHGAGRPHRRRHRPHRRVHRARHGRGLRGGPADQRAAPGRGARRGGAGRRARQRRRAARVPRAATH